MNQGVSEAQREKLALKIASQAVADNNQLPTLPSVVWEINRLAQDDRASAADLEGTKVAPGDDGDGVCIDVYRPQERFVRIVRERGASSTAESVVAIQYGARKPPVDNASDIDTELHVSPAEGTA